MSSTFRRGTMAFNDVMVRTYPDVSGLVAACEEVISNWEADGEPGPAAPAS